MFRRKKTDDTVYKYRVTRTEWPSGTAVITPSGTFYIKGNKRYRVSESVYISWSFPLVIPCADAAVSHLPIAGNLGFREGTLIKDIGTSAIYLISDNKRRHVTSVEAYSIVNPYKIEPLLVSSSDLDFHKEGEPLNAEL